MKLALKYDPQIRPKLAPKRPAKRHPHTVSPAGIHHGGSCKECGGSLTYWIHYQLCDYCLKVTP